MKSPVRALVLKEARALLPIELAGLGVVVAVTAAWGMAGSLGPLAPVRGLAMPAFVLCTLALGAHVVGQEYGYRTLGQLMTLPFSRARLLGIKLAVLLAMIAPLAIAAIAFLTRISQAGFVVRSGTPPVVSWFSTEVVLLTVACGMTTAPWFTMLGRNPLAGIVFTIAIPFLLLVAGNLVGSLVYGVANAAAIDQLARWIFWIGMAAFCVAGAIGTRRRFVGLEVTDGRGHEVALPQGWRIGSTAAVSRTARHPLLQLAVKELRVQQLAMVVAAIYVVMWMAALLVERAGAPFNLSPIVPLSVFYVGTISMLIGSLTSAEERQFGTLEGQLLLPIAGWLQWTIKVAVAFLLALVLGAGVSLAIVFLLSVATPHGAYYALLLKTSTVAGFVPIAISMVVLSMYVSSWSSSGLRAMVGSVPAFVVGVVAVQYLDLLARTLGIRAAVRSAVDPIGFGPSLLASLVVAGVAVRFAFVNHRSLDRGASRILRQIAWLVLAAAIAVIFRPS